MKVNVNVSQRTAIQFPTDALPYVRDELAQLGSAVSVPYFVDEYYSAVDVPANLALRATMLVNDALRYSAGE